MPRPRSRSASHNTPSENPCLRWHKDYCPGWNGNPHYLEAYQVMPCGTRRCRGPGDPAHVQVPAGNSRSNAVDDRSHWSSKLTWRCYQCRFDQAKATYGRYNGYPTAQGYVDAINKGTELRGSSLREKDAAIRRAEEDMNAYATRRAGRKGRHGR